MISNNFESIQLVLALVIYSYYFRVTYFRKDEVEAKVLEEFDCIAKYILIAMTIVSFLFWWILKPASFIFNGQQMRGLKVILFIFGSPIIFVFWVVGMVFSNCKKDKI